MKNLAYKEPSHYFPHGSLIPCLNLSLRLSLLSLLTWTPQVQRRVPAAQTEEHSLDSLFQRAPCFPPTVSDPCRVHTEPRMRVEILGVCSTQSPLNKDNAPGLTSSMCLATQGKGRMDLHSYSLHNQALTASL